MINLKQFSIFILITFSSIVLGQNNKSEINNGRIEEDYKFLPIPYINYNRSLGFQLGAMPMLQFNPVSKDTLSPSSLAGIFGMYSSNKSYFIMIMSKLYFDSDNWRFMFGGGIGAVNFQFYLDNPIGVWVPYNSKLKMLFIETQRRIYKRIYLGLSYIYLNFDTKFEISPNVFTQQLQGFGLKITMDYRANIYYPKNGFFNNLKYFSYPEFMGNETASHKIEINHNHFFPIRNGQDVLATRAFIGFGIGDLSFNQQFIVGNGEDIRGYSQGEYRGNSLIAIQGEYRWNLNNSKIGFVSFLGFATVINGEKTKILPGIGVGFRYTVVEETHMNVGMDFAKGNGDWGVYFRIGEAFSR